MQEDQKEKLLQNHKETKEETINPKIEKFEEDIPKCVKEYGYLNKDPINSSNFISKLFLYWAYKIIKLSNLIKLQPKFLGKLSGENTTKEYLKSIKNIWDEKDYKSIKKHALLLSGFRANLNSLFIILIFSVIRSGSNILQITLFRQFLKKFNKNIQKENTIYDNFSHIQIGIAYLLLKLFEIFFQRQAFEYQMTLGFKSETEFSTLIYDKLLKMSPSSMKKKASTGEITNFIQVDSRKLQRLMLMSKDLLTMPIMLIAYIYMLFQFLGIAFIYGIGTMIFFSIINLFLSKIVRSFFKLVSSLRDTRMKIITETFNNIKILKLYSWEDEFKNRINESRNNEMNTFEKLKTISNFSQSFGWLGPVATSTVCIGAYQYINGRLEIEDILTCMNILGSIQGPMRMIPNILNNFYQTVISMSRIENFLRQDDIDESRIIKNDPELIKDNIAIKIENGFFSWGIEYDDENDMKFKRKKSRKLTKSKQSFHKLNSTDNTKNKNLEILKDINLTIKKGEFIIIIGEVGSGKSSLLSAILNNMIPLKKETKIYVNGTISYIRQIPWIQNATVKNNILFFQNFDNEKYKKIIDICELKTDLEILSGGDLTEIGEKGVNLSGGQKSRIALARCLYADKDIYFLDDPISALDANVGMNILKNCFIKYLEGKTRILATHALQYCQYADKILYMKDGKIEWFGNYEEIKKMDFFVDFYQSTRNPLTNKSSAQIRFEFLNEESEESDFEESELSELNDGVEKRITKDEELSDEIVNKDIYYEYIKYIGGFIIIVFFLIFLLASDGLKSGQDLFLGYWTEHQSKEKNNFYLLIYVSFGIGGAIFNFFRIYLSSKGAIKASRFIHEKMTECLIRAPISTFHETIPKGQIFNRFSKEIQSVDSSIMESLVNFISSMSALISAIFVCAYYQPNSLLILPFLIILGYKITKFYQKCARELTRMESIVRSPLINTLNETIPGLMSIRAYGLINEYLNKWFYVSDENLKVKLILRGVSQWFDLALDLLCFIFVVFLVIFTFLFKEKFSPKIIGLLLTYCFSLQRNLTRGLKQTTTLETSMICFERCLEYTKIQSEAAKKLNNDIKLKNWPKEGKIEFINFSTKYRPDTEIVLSNLNFLIEPNKKIGICGRTGSGKSTITLCLFRILESISGKILIDDIDISKIGLDKLRSSLTIIPQDPCLFQGTLKYNIDPLNQYSNEEILKVFQKISFDYIINKNPKGFNMEVAEGGTNLSVGEKQLICIARAILRKTKIIIMDEATANIDYETEEIIQKAIGEIMNDSTIITIAHRIKTIIKYDKILVLDKGVLMDFDSPEELLKKKEGIFYELYNKSH